VGAQSLNTAIPRMGKMPHAATPSCYIHRRRMVAEAGINRKLASPTITDH
jgi:hypothetical protein